MMKKTYILLATAACLFTTSCSNEEINGNDNNSENVLPNGMIQRTFYVGEILSSTRADREGEGMEKILWENGDIIYYYDNTDPGAIHIATVKQDKAYKAYVEITIAESAEKITFLYKGKLDKTNDFVYSSDGKIVLDNALLTEQDGKFTNISSVTIDSRKADGSVNTSAELQNANSWLKIVIDDTSKLPAGLDHMVLMGYRNEDLAGELQFAPGSAATSASNWTTINYPSPKAVVLKPETWKAQSYYFNILPGTLEKGLTIYLEDASNNFLGSVEVTGAATFERSKIKTINNFTNHIIGDDLVDNHNYVVIGNYMWATCNVGANFNSPRFAGSYYHWGEVNPIGTTAVSADGTTVIYPTKDNVKYAYATFSNPETYPAVAISTKLTGKDQDAANNAWEGLWRLPSGGFGGLRNDSPVATGDLFNDGAGNYDRRPTAQKDGETVDLWQYTTHYSATLNNINGVRFFDEDGGSIFLAAGGTWEDNPEHANWKGANQEGFYMTNTPVHEERGFVGWTVCHDLYIVAINPTPDWAKSYNEAAPTCWYKFRPRNVRPIYDTEAANTQHITHQGFAEVTVLE